MADKEHLKILNQGVDAWNEWREKEPEEVRPDLRGADLRGADLRGARLEGARLEGIVDAVDEDDDIIGGYRGTDLQDANLGDARLTGANLTGANLQSANLEGVSLLGADLSGANLQGANLEGADLVDARLTGVNLAGANLTSVLLYGTIFGNVDLSEATGLVETDDFVPSGTIPLGPSTIGTDTLTMSKGQIPEAFLRGCGLQDWEIEAAKLWNPDLSEQERIDVTYRILEIQGESPIVLHRVFISYSHEDEGFVEKIEAGLKKKHIPYWRDVHDLKAGPLESQLEHAIVVSRAVLLILSARSVESDSVAWEVRKARELRKKEKRHVLCPIALDDSWKRCDWPDRLREQVKEYNILDFSDPDAFGVQFEKLVAGIVEFYPAK